MAFVKDGFPRPVIIPKYESIGLDIILSNLRTAKMNRTQYFKLLGQC